MHPLEPLAPDEVRLAVSILRDTGKVTPTTRFVSLSLKEPPKAAVHSGKDAHRAAFAVLFDNATNSCFEAAVCLFHKKVILWKHVPGVQPSMTADEMIECEQAVLKSPEFQAALKKQYGITDTSLVKPYRRMASSRTCVSMARLTGWPACSARRVRAEACTS